MLHSPSSIALATRCRRAWWLRYRDKIRPPEVTWAQIQSGEVIPVGGQRSAALGKEVHRLAEIYLATPRDRIERKHLIDWSDLPGQCLAELVPHLPPAGSVPRKNLERRVTVKVNGVSFQGVIDVVGAAAHSVVESYDHKSTGDIRAYALLPHAVAVRTKQPKRSLRDDLQACMYVLARAKESKPVASGGICRWNYTETKRSRRSLPVVQYIPTTHARTIAERAAVVAREVEGYRTRDEATPDTTACHDYGGCWYRIDGHCTVKRRWGLVINRYEREQKEKEAMGKQLSFNKLRGDSEKANAREEAEAEKVKAKAKAKARVAEAEDSDEEDEDEDDAPASVPAPKAKGGKAKPAPVEVEEVEEDEDAPDSKDYIREESKATPAPKAEKKSARATAQEAFDKATSAPDHIIRFFDPTGYAKGEPRVIATGFAELAAGVADLPRNPERHMALRKLLEARDCAVRALSTDE